MTVGSMTSPVGNPQNILIATNGQFENPVATFGLWLIVPTIVSLAFVFCWSRFLIKRPTQATQPNTTLCPIRPTTRASGRLSGPGGAGASDRRRQRAAGRRRVRSPYGISSLIACAPIFVAGNRRIQTFKEVDWPTLAFFVAMFVVTGSLLQSGSLQTMLGTMQDLSTSFPSPRYQLLGEPTLLQRSRVDMYLKLMPHGDTSTL